MIKKGIGRYSTPKWWSFMFIGLKVVKLQGISQLSFKEMLTGSVCSSSLCKGSVMVTNWNYQWILLQLYKSGIFLHMCRKTVIFTWVCICFPFLCLRAFDLTAISIISFQDNHPLASLPLLGYSLTLPSESENIHKDYVFKLHFKSHVYYFRAESEYTFER